MHVTTSDLTIGPEHYWWPLIHFIASSTSPHMWLADGDSLMYYIVSMSRLIACMFYLFFSMYGNIGLFRNGFFREGFFGNFCTI